MIDRYTTPEMRELWSERAKFQSWLDVELAVCEAWAKLGKIPPKDLRAIKKGAKFSVPRIEKLDRRLHHDVIAFTTNLAENIGPSSRFVHLGLTSTDVVDTAQSLRLREAGRLIMDEVNEFIETLAWFSGEHMTFVMIGRTHGVHAEPTMLGFKFLVFHQEMLRNRARLADAIDGVTVGKISGAVGTYSHTGPRLEEAVCKRLGLKPARVSNQILQRDRHAAFVAALAITGGTIEKIAMEIRHLQRTEVRELEEPFAIGQKGSSAMPHKRNPVKCEQLCGLARLLRGYALTAMENQALWHERDISHSSAERVLLADSTTLVHYMARQMETIVRGLHVYREAMHRNINLTRGLLFSQTILLALVNKGMTREKAYDIVQRAAMKTWNNEKLNLRDALLADDEFKRVMNARALDSTMDHRRLLRYIDGISRRVNVSWYYPSDRSFIDATGRRIWTKASKKRG